MSHKADQHDFQDGNPPGSHSANTSKRDEPIRRSSRIAQNSSSARVSRVEKDSRVARNLRAGGSKDASKTGSIRRTSPGQKLDNTMAQQDLPVSHSRPLVRNESPLNCGDGPVLNSSIEADVFEDSHSGFHSSSANEYNFLATEETPPTDVCLPRFCFDPSLNQSASEYAAMKERRRLRQLEADLLMGLLGHANQDDVISVNDVKEFTEGRISSFGVTSVSFNTASSGEVTVTTEGVTQIEEVFSPFETFDDKETLLVNGVVAPCPTRREGVETYAIPWNESVLQDVPCQLCSSEDSLFQFHSRHRKENVKHILSHNTTLKGDGRYHLPTAETGRYVETTFSADLTLQSTTGERMYNFLPTPADMNEAVEIVREDDHIPRSDQLSSEDVIIAGLECLSSLNLTKLLQFYYCAVNSVYEVRGSTIRHFQLCRSYIPAPKPP